MHVTIPSPAHYAVMATEFILPFQFLDVEIGVSVSVLVYILDFGGMVYRIIMMEPR